MKATVFRPSLSFSRREKKRDCYKIGICRNFFITYIFRPGLMGLKLHYATGSAPCFHPVNLSAMQDGVEVLLWICDGLEVIGVHKSFDDGL